MNPLDLTIDQFQRIIAVEQVPGISDADLKVSVVSIVLNKTPDEVKQMSLYDVGRVYKSVQDFGFPELPYKQKIQIGKDYYHFDLYADKLKAGQLVELFEYNMNDQNEVVQNMHKILASISRKCRVWRFLSEKYNGATHDKRAEAMKQMTLRDAYGIVGFFLRISQPLLNALATYSSKTKTTTAKGLSRWRRTAG